MFDPSMLISLTESEAAKPLIDNFMESFARHYSHPKSDIGEATRAIVLALASPTHEIYKGMSTIEARLLSSMAKDLNKKFMRTTTQEATNG